MQEIMTRTWERVEKFFGEMKMNENCNEEEGEGEREKGNVQFPVCVSLGIIKFAVNVCLVELANGAVSLCGGGGLPRLYYYLTK